MNLDEHVKQYLAMNDWFNSPQGLCISSAIADEIEHFVTQLRGDCLLQLGLCGESPWLPLLQYNKKLIISPCMEQKDVNIACGFNQLPLDRNSVDCIVAPFTFETFSIDKNPFDEFDRILKPMGYMVILGINPVSFWGLALRSGFLKIFGEENSKLTSVFSVKRAALNRGYRQCALSTFNYILPVKSKKWIDRLEFLNEMGKMLWIYPAGFYCLIVQKHELIEPTLIQNAIEENFLACVDNSLA